MEAIEESWAWTEMRSLKLGDERFRPNLVKMCLKLEQNPEQAFTTACGYPLRKTATRLFTKHEGSLLDGHTSATAERIKQHGFVIIAEDTQEISYNGHKASTGLGYVAKGVIGLSMHNSLAITPDKQVLGLIAQHIWAPTDKGREHANSAYPLEEKETYRWVEALKKIDELLTGYKGTALIVSDREADLAEYLLYPTPHKLLVRARHYRRKVIYNNEEVYLNELIEKLPGSGTKTIDHKYRDPQTGIWHKRKVQLNVIFIEVILPATRNSKGMAERKVNVVCCRETNPLKEVEPLEWILLTTLEVNSFEDALQVLEYYAMRWTVERFHFVQKQGLMVEGLQFDCFERLRHALEICSVVSCRLMQMNYSLKQSNSEEAGICFDEQEIEVLENIAKKK